MKILALSLTLLASTLSLISTPSYAIETINPVLVATNLNTAFGTFNSHNQKVISNQHGIFITYLYSQNGNYTSNQWILAQSTDGGNTFVNKYSWTGGSSAPALDTDEIGNIYLAHPDWNTTDMNLYIYRFSAPSNFTNPDYILTVPYAGDGKYSMIIDNARNQLYVATNRPRLVRARLDGTLLDSRAIFVESGGDHAYLAYPHLYLDNSTLYLAWTNQKRGPYMYWDIHFMKSQDGGSSWQKIDDTPLTPLIIPDDTGPTDRLTLDDEFEFHTWLSSFVVKNGKAHFMYLAQTNPNRQHYVRYDLKTAKIDKNLYPTWTGSSISLLSSDGFFATDPNNPDSPLYAVGRGTSNKLSVLVSNDNGESWHDYAESVNDNHNLYSVGGSRTIIADDYLLGTYTHQGTNNQTDTNKVMFFRTKLSTSQNFSTFNGDLNYDGKVDILDFNKLISNFGNPYSLIDFNNIVVNFDKSR